MNDLKIGEMMLSKFTKRLIGCAFTAAGTWFLSSMPARAADISEKMIPGKVIHVAIYQDSATPDLSAQVVDNALRISPSFVTKRVDAQGIRTGALDGMDVLVQPGGSGSAQAKKLEPAGCDKIKQFVKAGGGYVGICAGSYLASSHYTWSLHLLNAEVVDTRHWARGFGVVELKLSPTGETMLDIDKEIVNCIYHQGPLLAPGHEEGLAPYEPIATFKTEVAKNGAPPGVMLGTTAMARGIYGKGHVFACSPHPEKTDGLDNIVRRAVEWAATGEVGKVHAPTTRPITLAEATASMKHATTAP
jgi:putative intracellular protease/amidase